MAPRHQAASRACRPQTWPRTPGLRQNQGDGGRSLGGGGRDAPAGAALPCAQGSCGHVGPTGFVGQMPGASAARRPDDGQPRPWPRVSCRRAPDLCRGDPSAAGPQLPAPAGPPAAWVLRPASPSTAVGSSGRTFLSPAKASVREACWSLLTSCSAPPAVGVWPLTKDPVSSSQEAPRCQEPASLSPSCCGPASKGLLLLSLPR